LPDGTTAQPGMAEAIELQRQAGHPLYADHLFAMLYGTGLNPARSAPCCSCSKIRRPIS
jgi:hypothetical protein